MTSYIKLFHIVKIIKILKRQRFELLSHEVHVPSDTPRQKYGINCGVYVCSFLKCLIAGAKIEQIDCEKFRLEMIEALKVVNSLKSKGLGSYSKDNRRMNSAELEKESKLIVKKTNSNKSINSFFS